MLQWNLQWLNHNAQRAYPLADWGHKRDSSDTIQLPDSFLLALHLPVHSGLDVEPAKFYLQSLGIYPTGYSIAIGYDDGSATPPLVASTNIAKVTHQENRAYAVAGVDDFADTVGHLTIGKLDEIDLLPPGFYTFEPDATPLEPDTIRPSLRGISSVTIVNGSDRSQRLYGDVELIAGNNMRLTVNQSPGFPAQIVFSAISGEGLNEECICDENVTGLPIRFINGIPPLPDGNFRMVGDDCIEIAPIENGLEFHDQCSQPCCGCDLLDPLTRQIEKFADGVATLRHLATDLRAEVTQMSMVVLGSKLNDQGCVDC